jgi:hypothetical protein
MIMTCPNCDMDYDDFRTGMDYVDVYATFWRAEDDPSDWHPKRRNSVLGRWREIKQSMWAEHLARCEDMEPVNIDGIEEY